MVRSALPVWNHRYRDETPYSSLTPIRNVHLQKVQRSRTHFSGWCLPGEDNDFCHSDYIFQIHKNTWFSHESVTPLYDHVTIHTVLLTILSRCIFSALSAKTLATPAITDHGECTSSMVRLTCAHIEEEQHKVTSLRLNELTHLPFPSFSTYKML